MEFRELVIGDIVAKIPLIQGGMGVGVSLSSLAGAVAKEGGIGIISTAQIGYRENDYETNPVEANLRAIKTEIEKAKEISNGGIIGVNIMVATRYYERYIESACKAGADIIICGAGVPVNLPELVKGYETKIAPIVSSRKSAAVLLKLWERKYNRYPDAVVIEGPKAGGHLGFKEEDVLSLSEEDYYEEVKAIMEVVKEYREKSGIYIPIVMGGGISDSDKISTMLKLGVDGVQVASRFVTTNECDASDEYKNMYLNAKEEDIVIVKSPVGMPGRAIKNKFLEKANGASEPIKKCYQCIRGCTSVGIPYCISKALVNAVKGNVQDGLLFCGADTWKQNKMQTVKEVIAELFELESEDTVAV